MIYDDFTRKVAAGRKLPLEKVQELARGRVWSGADAQARGLVDKLGGFWTAAGEAAALGQGFPVADMVFRVYPKPSGLWGRLASAMGGLESQPGRGSGGSNRCSNLPVLQAALESRLQPPSGRAPAAASSCGRHICPSRDKQATASRTLLQQSACSGPAPDL